MAATLFDKVWDLHVVDSREDGEDLLYVDLNIVSEGPFYAFDALRAEGRTVAEPRRTLAVADHYVPTIGRERGVAAARDPEARRMIEQLDVNAVWARLPHHYGIDHPRQGIMHIVPADLGMAHPGMIVTGSDSHTTTNGAFGAYAFGVGASQVKHILATQTVWGRRPRTMRVNFDGVPGKGVVAKDLILALIREIGTSGGVGHALEFAGPCIRAMGIEGRMTLCNMAIEAGARAGMVAPDETTFAYLRGREFAPSDRDWTAACAFWSSLVTDDGAPFDCEVNLDVARLAPMVTWGTCQEEAVGIDEAVPDPAAWSDPVKRRRAEKALEYMDLQPGTRMTDIAIDRVFIGSCTNSQLQDLREAAAVLRGRKAAIPGIVVPGSRIVKAAAEREGLNEVFVSAGLEWRDAGCSMCTGSNGDRLSAGERCASTSNRNFEGRQGRGSRTHLVSPAMAAAAALNGRLCDVRAI